MSGCDFTFAGAALTALPSGALWWAGEGLLCVSDLHLGKAGRIARRGGPMLPPYEVEDTLTRLDADISATAPGTVICLGDSFDDLAAADEISDAARDWILRLQAGRRWIWIEGNHDAGPTGLAGTHLAGYDAGALAFRHIASRDASAEVSGHYHPKTTITVRGRAITRPCFLYDRDRLILPAYGTFTGGLRSRDPVLAGLMLPGAMAILTGPNPVRIPMPGGAATQARDGLQNPPDCPSLRP